MLMIETSGRRVARSLGLVADADRDRDVRVEKKRLKGVQEANAGSCCLCLPSMLDGFGKSQRNARGRAEIQVKRSPAAVAFRLRSQTKPRMALPRWWLLRNRRATGGGGRTSGQIFPFPLLLSFEGTDAYEVAYKIEVITYLNHTMSTPARAPAPVMASSSGSPILGQPPLDPVQSLPFLQRSNLTGPQSGPCHFPVNGSATLA